MDNELVKVLNKMGLGKGIQVLTPKGKKAVAKGMSHAAIYVPKNEGILWQYIQLTFSTRQGKRK